MKTNSKNKVFERRSAYHLNNDMRLALLETVKSFCRKTTVHGMRFIVDDEIDENEYFKLSNTRKKISRCIWLVICLLGISMTCALVITFYGKFQTRPIMTSIDTTTYPVWGLDFPGVTICNINKVYKPQTKNITEKLLARGVTQENINYFFTDLSKLIDYENINASYIEIFKDIQLELIRMGLNMEKLMKEVAHPCSSMLLHCEWIQKEIPCNNLFRMTKSSVGFCCSFNYMALKDNYEVDSADHNRSPYRVDGAGRGSGLSVIMDMGVESYMSTTLPIYGSQIIVHDPDDFPQTSFSSTIIQPGFVVELMITPSLIESQEVIESVATEQRQCYLKDEKKLRSTNHYTFKSCITECRVDSIRRICKCIPYIYPDTDLEHFNYISRICTLTDSQCLYENRHIFSTLKPDQPIPGLNFTGGLVCDACLPSCSRQSYLVSQALAKRNFDNGGKITKIEAIKNITGATMLFVNFKDIVCIKYTRDTLMKWDDLFAAFGGVFGLCIGGSVISFIEFIYFFTFKFLSNLKRRQVISAKPMELESSSKSQLNVNENYNDTARIDFLQRRRPPINNKTVGKYEREYLP